MAIKGLRQDEADSGARRRTKKANEWRDVDYIGAEERINVNGIRSVHHKRFGTKEEQQAWIDQKPETRWDRGMQRRLPLL